MVCALALFFLAIPSDVPDTWAVSGYARPMAIPGAYGSQEWRPVGGVRVLRRSGVLVGGALDFSTASTGTRMGSAQHLHLSGNCGISLPLAGNFRLDLMGEMGGHAVLPMATPACETSDSCESGRGLQLTPFLGALPSVEVTLSQRVTAGVGAVARLDILTLKPVVIAAENGLRYPELGRFSWGGDAHLSVRF